MIILAFCALMGSMPWIKDRLAFGRIKGTVAVTMKAPHGLKPGDDVMLLKGDGMPIPGHQRYKVVLTPTEFTLMLANHEVPIQD